MKFGLHNLKIMVIYKMLILYINIYMYRRRNDLADLQTKLGSGMNKLKEGIEQGKMKLQVAQEIAQLKNAEKSRGSIRGWTASVCSIKRKWSK